MCQKQNLPNIESVPFSNVYFACHHFRDDAVVGVGLVTSDCTVYFLQVHALVLWV